MRFTFSLVNGKFTNGKSAITISYDTLQLNSVYLHVKWNDISTPTADTAKISITNAYIVTDTAISSLQKVGIQKIVRKIASLKGQIPTLYAGPNRQINDNSQIIASVDDMAYPGIFEGVVPTNKKVRQFEWTLPTNWKTTTNQSGTFITDLDVKQITVIPDYVTVGSIKVRGVNDIVSAYSEYTTQNFDRGFSFTTFPQFIVYGDNTAKTFAVPLFSGLTYEWKVPSGWQINGQGSTLQGLNLNSESITPSFCTQTDGKVQVRLIKDTDVSDWYICQYSGVSTPYIPNPTSIYQYENTSFSISNIYPSNVSSVIWSGEDMVTITHGLSPKMIFKKPGTKYITASILINGCSTPIIIPKTVTVNNSRLSIGSTSQQLFEICDTKDYTITNLPTGNNVAWSITPPNLVSYPTTGYPINVSKVSVGKVTIQAIVNNLDTLTLPNVTVGAPYYLGISGISNLTMWDAGDFQVLPGSGYYAYEGTLSLADGVGLATNYVWSFVASSPGKPISWWSNGGSVDVAMKSSNTTLLLKCTASNSCGSYSQMYSFSNGDIIPMIITPNPSSTQAEVSIPDATAANSVMSTSTPTENLSAASYSVTVVDSYGLTVYTATVKDKKFNIPTSSFRNGIYAVVVSDSTNVYQKKLIVKH